MKLDREKFLAAAMILSATSTLGGCSKTEETADDSKSGIKATVSVGGTHAAQGPVGVKQVNAPAREGVAPAREAPAPAKEAPPPAAEGKPASTANGGRPPGAIKIPGKLARSGRGAPARRAIVAAPRHAG